VRVICGPYLACVQMVLGDSMCITGRRLLLAFIGKMCMVHFVRVYLVLETVFGLGTDMKGNKQNVQK
jgi:hypothetical protein